MRMLLGCLMIFLWMMLLIRLTLPMNTSSSGIPPWTNSSNYSHACLSDSSSALLAALCPPTRTHHVGFGLEPETGMDTEELGGRKNAE